LPDVPSIVELGRTDEARRILKFYAAADDIGRSLVAPPGMATERIATVRRGFDATMRDQLFLDNAAKVGLDIKPMSGEALQDMGAEVANFPPDLIVKARAAREGPK
jgi:hypothetical protein